MLKKQAELIYLYISRLKTYLFVIALQTYIDF